jgi:hypothetical protein
MESIIRYLIKKFLPGYHLSANPPKGRKNERHIPSPIEIELAKGMAQAAPPYGNLGNAGGLYGSPLYPGRVINND